MEKKKSAAGSFCIPHEAAHILMDSGSSASLACAYLILAGYTDASGTKSTAGLGAIRQRLGCREEVAERHVSTLIHLGLIKDLRDAKGSRSAPRNQPRFEISFFEEDAHSCIWFGRSLVDIPTSGSKYGSPISRLNDMSAECVHTLIWLHSLHHSEWTSVTPPYLPEGQPGVFSWYLPYEDDHAVGGDHSIKVYEQGGQKLVCSDAMAERFGFEKTAGAIKSLRDAGFIYEVVLAYNRPLLPLSNDPAGDFALDPECRPIFHVHGGGLRSGLPVEERGVSMFTLNLAKSVELNMLFDGERGRKRQFAVVTRSSDQIAVAGVFRLTHRVKNPKSRGVALPWGLMLASEAEYREWLASQLLRHYEIDLRKHPQFAEFMQKREAMADGRRES